MGKIETAPLGKVVSWIIFARNKVDKGVDEDQRIHPDLVDDGMSDIAEQTDP